MESVYIATSGRLRTAQPALALLGLPADTPMITIGVGLMSGGYGREELERAGAYRVYADPADLLSRADELGVRGLPLRG
jgi:hypothetical protein